MMLPQTRSLLRFLISSERIAERMRMSTFFSINTYAKFDPDRRPSSIHYSKATKKTEKASQALASFTKKEQNIRGDR